VVGGVTVVKTPPVPAAEALVLHLRGPVPEATSHSNSGR
jgi:hypothetical protein